MKPALFLKAAAAVLLLGTGASAQTRQPDKQSFNQIEHGRYLTVVGDCAACHDAPSGEPFAGGRPIETPFGNVLGANITPDQETGIGGWTDDQFIRAMTQGVSAHGSHLYPAMPYTYFVKVSRDDLLAIRAYLSTVEPVRNPLQTDQLPFPFNIRFSMRFWNWLFYDDQPFKPNPQKSAQWNRGAYLVEGLGHCNACHTPKNFLGGDQSGDDLAGSNLQGWFAPNITSQPHFGIGSWSVQDIVEYLKAGANRFTTASGPMAEQIVDSSSHWTLEDLEAVAVYLKDQQPKGSESNPNIAQDNPAMKVGQAIYMDQCAACHTVDGTGIQHLFPTLKGTPFVQSPQPTSLIHVVLEGTRAAATSEAPTSPAMPPFDWKLSDEQVAAVLTYIRNAWGNHASAVTAGDVKSTRNQLSVGAGG